MQDTHESMVFFTTGAVVTGVGGVTGATGLTGVTGVVVPPVVVVLPVEIPVVAVPLVVVPLVVLPVEPVLLMVPTAVLDDPELAAATVEALEAPLEPHPPSAADNTAMLAATRTSDRKISLPAKRAAAVKIISN